MYNSKSKRSDIYALLIVLGTALTIGGLQFALPYLT